MRKFGDDADLLTGGFLWGMEQPDQFTSVAFGVQPDKTVRILQMKLGAAASKP